MRLILLTCAIGLALSPLAATSQTPAGSAQIVGRVIDGDTNAPIAGARVMAVPVVRPVDGQGRPIVPMGPGGMMGSVTDENGRFVIDNVPAGRVRLSVQKQGFASDPMDAQSVELSAGQTAQVDVSLRRGGVVSGRILDDRGEPISDIRVMALRRISGRGDRVAIAGGPGSVTNDLGEFRIAGLAAGEYMVMATGQQQTPFGPGAGGGTAWAPTYYPGTTGQTEAQVVTVPQGDTVAGLEFRLISAPAFRVSGLVVDDGGKPVADGVVTLSPARVQGAGPMMPSVGHTNADGTFVIGGVIAGSYVVTASRMIRAASGSATVVAMGLLPSGPGQEVRVDGADVTGLRVIAASPRQ